MNIPTANDLTQDRECGKSINEIPEIRVWCHPHFINKKGDDYFIIFKTFEEALGFIKKHKEAERRPLIAFRGKEINIFDIEKIEKK